MNKKALYAVMLAMLLPLTAYFIVKRKSETAVTMPRHYLPDSVVTVTKKGKRVEDTAWHRLADFALTNQEGRPVSWDSMKGKIIIANFFFTHCPTICPGLTLNMKRMAESIHNGQRVGDRTNKQVHFLSFSIDPERDSVERLKYWADKYQIDPEQWWLLTGDKKAIYNMVIEEMKVGLVDGQGVDTNFIHSDRFVLIDSNRHVRGYYKGLDSVDLAKLSNDLVLLTMEKDPKSKSFFDGKLELMAIVFLLAILGVGLLLFFIRKKQ
ncbi:MAG: SCO family protein [Chitinophagaceae bacterium]|nr:SCO family protein [Chitinophagaceae bacterium]MBK9660560.1 SCO family protein [Chitinophagaceae bacterium]